MGKEVGYITLGTRNIHFVIPFDLLITQSSLCVAWVYMYWYGWKLDCANAQVYKTMHIVVLGLRILSLGVGLIPHLPATSVLQANQKRSDNAPSNSVNTQKQMADIVMDDFRSIETQLHEVVPQSAVAAASVNTDEIHDVTKRVQMPTQTEREVLQNMWTQTEKQKRQKKYKAKLDIASQIKGNIVDDIIVTNTVCPPPLFFNHDLEPKHKGHLDLINNLLQQGESCTPADDSDSSEEDTIRLEDISDSELEYKRTAYDSFKQRKSRVHLIE